MSHEAKARYQSARVVGSSLWDFHEPIAKGCRRTLLSFGTHLSRARQTVREVTVVEPLVIESIRFAEGPRRVRRVQLRALDPRGTVLTDFLRRSARDGSWSLGNRVFPIGTVLQLRTTYRTRRQRPLRNRWVDNGCVLGVVVIGSEPVEKPRSR